MYRVSQEEWTKLRESVPYVELYRYDPEHPVAYRGGAGVWGVQTPPPRNSDDIGGVLDRMSKKNRRLDFLLQFTVFSYGCNLLNKGFF